MGMWGIILLVVLVMCTVMHKGMVLLCSTQNT